MKTDEIKNDSQSKYENSTTGYGVTLKKGSKLVTLNGLSNEDTSASERERRDADTKLFKSNLNLLIAKTDRILADSRMAWAKTGVRNGLAYTGPFPEAPLGAYLTWYRDSKEDSHDRDGNPIWFISGSPLSGANTCSVVDENGSTHKANIGSFLPVWTSFQKILDGYLSNDKPLESYSLLEVITILKSEQ